MSINNVNDIIDGANMLDNMSSISRKIISRFINIINNIRLVSPDSRPNIYIGYELLDYVTQLYNYVPIPVFSFQDGNTELIGNVSGSYVYISSSLYGYEYFIGNDDKEIQVIKRTEKLNKIINNI